MDDDDLLAGYLDNALDDGQRSALEMRLQVEPALAARLAAFTRNDAELRAAFDAPLVEPVPARFLTLIPAPAPAETVIPFAPRQADIRVADIPVAANDNRRHWRWIGGALAAGLALAVVVGTQMTGPQHDPRLGDALAFNTALETTPSAQARPLSNGKALTPQMSFASRDGNFCRQFAVVGSTETLAGVACRRSGTWSVKALVPGTAAAMPPEGFETAGGAINPALDRAIAALRAGDPLNPAAERDAIKNGWRAAP